MTKQSLNKILILSPLALALLLGGACSSSNPALTQTQTTPVAHDWSAPVARPEFGREPAAQTDIRAAHLRATREFNAPIVAWADENTRHISDMLAHRGDADGIPDFLDWYLVDDSKRIQVRKDLTREAARVAWDTKDLYNQYFPKEQGSSYFATFFEAGHPWVAANARGRGRPEYQWNSLRMSEMENPTLFRKVIQTLVKDGVRNIRIAPNLHEIKLDPVTKVVDPASLDIFFRQVTTIWDAGAIPTISVAFFPSLKRWETLDASGKVDYSRSYLLHPEWPSDMGKITEGLMDRLLVESKRHGNARFIINPINEPETLAGFNRHFWHGAYADWSSPEKFRYYVPSLIAIGKANVKIRLAVEAKARGKRILFMHNEAMTPSYYPSHAPFGRFACSKFMLSDSVLRDTDFVAKYGNLQDDQVAALEASLRQKAKRASKDPSALHETEWSFLEYAFGGVDNRPHGSIGQQKEALHDLAARFNELRATHAELERKYKKTMRTDTMLQLDYYYQTEFVPTKSVDKTIQDLAANNAEGLKTVLGVSGKPDSILLKMVANAASNQSGDLPGGSPEGRALNDSSGPIIRLPENAKSAADIDWVALLKQDDGILFERLIGMRRGYDLSTQPEMVERQKRAGIIPFIGEIHRTDGYLDRLAPVETAGVDHETHYKKLKEALGVSTYAEARAMVEAAALKADAEPATPFTQADTIRDILNRNGRAAFHRLFGMKRNWSLGFEPQTYARNIRAGIRYGFYRFFMDYVNALEIYTAGVGESGTPFYYFAPLLHEQILMEYSAALKSGVYATHYAFGPAVDTRGWSPEPLGLHYVDSHFLNPSGAIQLLGRKDISLVIPKDATEDERKRLTQEYEAKVMAQEKNHSQRDDLRLRYRGNPELKSSWMREFTGNVFDSMKKIGLQVPDTQSDKEPRN